MASSAEDWTKPSTRPEVIDQLVEGVDRYNPANVNLLEDYLYHQIREQEYDCLANLAILKLSVCLAFGLLCIERTTRSPAMLNEDINLTPICITRTL